MQGEGAMTAGEWVYRRTDAGDGAWERGGAVSEEFRYILGLIGRATPVRTTCARLHRCSESQVLAWLVELENLGLLERVQASSNDALFADRLPAVAA
jgi:hypothetical protein